MPYPTSGLVLDGSRSPTKGPIHENPLIPKEEDTVQVLVTSSVQAGGQEDGGIGSSTADRLEDQRIHKRMVEFVKKRVVLLEKALNAEYHQEAMVGNTVDIFPQPSNIFMEAL